MHSYCSNCGTELQQGAAFCAGCGHKVQTVAVANPAIIRLKKWHIIILLISIVSVTTYFVFLNKKKTADLEARLQNPPVRHTSEDNTAYERQAVMKKLDPGEREQILNTITAFYDAENNEDVSTLLSHYAFPVERYYQLYNVGYDQLHKMVVDAYNGKLYYHNIDIKWDYSTIAKTESGAYKVLLYADYTSASEAADDRVTRRLHLVLLLNEFEKITAIYPV